ncbi:hypothetical protein PVK06_011872 [Gossypium arboreum]|uniref:Uncharacterized protein n=1 Tax=Gossypium arboreum TaxID=29729 RepID=A0ABR0QAF5_GOSAR|nr:hypothetical protein PVK06_011872 [Gossypium arboreum]
MAWDTYKPKGMSGLGFKDLRLFNIVLLGRQVWRLINHKDILFFDVFSSKYFSDEMCFILKRSISLPLLGRVSRLWLNPLKLDSVGKLGIVEERGLGWIGGFLKVSMLIL